MKKQKKKPEKKSDFEQGCEIVKQHDMFGRVAFPYMVRDDNRLGKNAAAMIARTRMNMTIYYNEKAHLSPKEWAYVLVHCYLPVVLPAFQLCTLFLLVLCPSLCRRWIVCRAQNILFFHSPFLVEHRLSLLRRISVLF